MNVPVRPCRAQPSTESSDTETQACRRDHAIRRCVGGPDVMDRVGHDRPAGRGHAAGTARPAQLVTRRVRSTRRSAGSRARPTPGAGRLQRRCVGARQERPNVLCHLSIGLEYGQRDCRSSPRREASPSSTAPTRTAGRPTDGPHGSEMHTLETRGCSAISTCLSRVSRNYGGATVLLSKGG